QRARCRVHRTAFVGAGTASPFLLNSGEIPSSDSGYSLLFGRAPLNIMVSSPQPGSCARGKARRVYMILNSKLAASLGLLLLAGSACLSSGAEPLRRDMTKSAIETPTRRLLSVPSPMSMERQPVNRKVQPGLVHWHREFESALVAA